MAQNIWELFRALRHQITKVTFVAIKQKSLLQEFRNFKVLPVTRLSQSLFDSLYITFKFGSLFFDYLMNKKIVWLERHYLQNILLS